MKNKDDQTYEYVNGFPATDDDQPLSPQSAAPVRALAPTAPVRRTSRPKPGVNRVVLLGYVSVAGLTQGTTNSGSPCARFVLKVWEQGHRGERKVMATSIMCELLRENLPLGEGLAAGQMVLVEGRLRQRFKNHGAHRTFIAVLDLSRIPGEALVDEAPPSSKE